MGTMIIAGVGAIVALEKIAQKIVLYMAGLHGPDATLYWTMGNAIRNGLTIYKDIFDPKPPGMFLLSALSFSLFESGVIGDVLNVLILLAIPLLFVYWTRKRGSTDVLLALMVGLTITLYNATIGGDWQTEFYGAFCGLLYVAAIERYQRHTSTSTMGATMLACFTFSIALLLKEPFLITLTAAALLLLNNRREWFRLWLLPVFSACATYAAALTSLGAFSSYVGIYLQGMLGNYILRGGTGPVWARGIAAWERIWTNVLDFNGAFPFLILFLVLLAIPRPAVKRESRFRLGIVITILGVLLTGRSFSPVPLPWHVDLMPSLVVFAIGIGVIIASLPPRRWLKAIGPLVRPLLAVYLTFTAIGLGSDFHGQYFALAIPVYGAFFLTMLARLSDRDAKERQRLTAGLTVLCSLLIIGSAPFVPPSSTLGKETQLLQTTEQRDRDAAEALDRILVYCNVDRYYFFHERGYMPYAEHSPLNYYLYTAPEHIGRYHPVFREPNLEHFHNAQIIVLSQPYTPHPRNGNTDEEAIAAQVSQVLAEQFTRDPWTCAKDLPQPKGYFLLFRKET